MSQKVHSKLQYRGGPVAFQLRTASLAIGAHLQHFAAPQVLQAVIRHDRSHRAVDIAALAVGVSHLWPAGGPPQQLNGERGSARGR